MSTIIGNAVTNEKNAIKAVEQVCNKALHNFKGEVPDIVFVFASTVYDFKVLLEKIKEKTNCKQIVGCSTAGEFVQNEAVTGGLSIMAIKSDTMKIITTKAQNLKGNTQQAIDEHFGNFKEEVREMSRQEFRYPTVMLLVDGLLGSGEEFIKGIFTKTGILSQLVGGAAGDDAKLKETYVFFNGEHFSNGAVFIKIFSKNKVGVGVSHGMKNASKTMRATKVQGATLYELDGRPAFEVYKEYAATKGITLTKENANVFLINNELAIQDLTFTKIRAPLICNEDGSFAMATEIPQDSLVAIVDAVEQNLIKAANDASMEANKNLAGVKASGVLVFDCICRQSIMGDKYVNEMKEISSVFGENVPVTGFSTYGEIAKYSGTLNGYHNSTVVVCALPE
ncbi:MAG: FIST N-terminal domain-containing protein [Candidatus Sericytochromatia bacterium]